MSHKLYPERFLGVIAMGKRLGRFAGMPGWSIRVPGGGANGRALS